MATSLKTRIELRRTTQTMYELKEIDDFSFKFFVPVGKRVFAFFTFGEDVQIGLSPFGLQKPLITYQIENPEYTKLVDFVLTSGKAQEYKLALAFVEK